MYINVTVLLLIATASLAQYWISTKDKDRDKDKEALFNVASVDLFLRHNKDP